MRLWHRIFPDKRKVDLDEELQSHLRMAIADRIERGQSPEIARRAALKEMGNLPLIQDVTRQLWGWLWLEQIILDLLHALRQLRKTPGFTFITVITLTLAIGANTAIFSLTYAMLLQSLPVAQPDRLVQIEVNGRETVDAGEWKPTVTLSGGFFDAISEQQKVFSGMCAWSSRPLNLTTSDGTRPVDTAQLTGDCFRTLGIRPALGRLFTAEEDRPGGGPGGYPVVLSYAYWTAHMNADPSVLGKSLNFEGKPGVIVGVADPSFHGMEPGGAPSFYVPSEIGDHEERHQFGSFNRLIFGRLKDGVSPQHAAAQLDPAYNAWIDAHHPEWRTAANAFNSQYRQQQVIVEPARTGYTYLRKETRKPLLILQLLVALCLLIACAYLAMMFSARALSRRHELALRAALGASRVRIVRQLLSEGLIVAITGAAMGTLFAWGAGRVILSFLTAGGQQLNFDLSPNTWVLLFTIAVCAVTVFLFGLGPALRASRVDPSTDMRNATKAGRQSIGGFTSRRQLGAWIIPVQIAFSLVLVVTAVLLSGSLVRLLSQDRGFRTRATVFIVADFSRRAEKKTDLAPLLNGILDRLNNAPGIQSASLAETHPLAGAMYIYPLSSKLPSGELRRDDRLPALTVAPRYLETVGTPLISGREFNASDRKGSPRVCMLNRSAAQYFFPNGKALGGFLDASSEGRQQIQVVGITQDIKFLNLGEAAKHIVYLPYQQDTLFNYYIEFVMNASDTAMAAASLRNVFKDLAPDVSIADPITMQQMVDSSASLQRLLATLSNFFALLALLLTAIGVYGLLNYAVTSRKPEIGVRVALGATRGNILSLIFTHAARLVLPGLVLGVFGAAAMTRLLKSLLYETRPLDPGAFAISIAAFLVIVALACALPARRAASIDPMEALRSE